MKTLLLTIAAGLGTLVPTHAQESAWLTDFEAAKAAAKKAQRPILVDFTGSDWCGWCIKLKDEVFDTKTFGKWAADNVVLLELDFPRKTEQTAERKKQNRALQKHYGVRGFPTILFLDHEGNELARSGYKRGGADKWIADAEQKLAKTAAAEAAAWRTDYEAALREAKQQGKLVLADFTGSDWCGWCIKLKDEVFEKPAFQKWAAENVVLLELDFPRRKELPKELREQNDKLRKKHGVRGYPTILFLDHDGEEVGRSGYVRGGPDAWIAAAEKEVGDELKKLGDRKRK